MMPVLPPLVIGDLAAPIPVIQAGMGLRVAMSNLAAAVARTGAIGCISSVGMGRVERSLDDYTAESNEKLAWEIRNARRLAPNGILAVNAMVAMSNYDEIIGVCVQEGVDIIISGAGLPLKLPQLTADSAVKLVPVVSSARALNLILRTWDRRYQVMPDAVIIEGPLCGGHLGFSYDQIEHPDTVALPQLLEEIRATLQPYADRYGKRIPLLGAEEVSSADDVLRMLQLGFDGAHVGTRFICTTESGLARASKEVWVEATAEDIVVIQSPLGMPVRVLRTPLVERLLKGERIPFTCPFQCLRACEAGSVKFCIADALVHTYFGHTDRGLFMTGCAVGKVNDIISVTEFFEPLKNMIEARHECA
jgi:nitronate monooxygenase